MNRTYPNRPLPSALKQPIIMNPFEGLPSLLAVGSIEEQQKQFEANIAKQKSEAALEFSKRLIVLAGHYGLTSNVTHETFWQSLALCLIDDFIPGLTITDKQTVKGRPKKWDPRTNFSLYLDISKLQKTGKSVRSACAILAKDPYWAAIVNVNSNKQTSAAIRDALYKHYQRVCQEPIPQFLDKMAAMGDDSIFKPFAVLAAEDKDKKVRK
jgi:hypothetical protein